MSVKSAQVRSDCALPSPLALPVTAVQLPDGHSALRGVLAALGTPLQNLSLFPLTGLNDTWVYNVSSPQCSGGESEPACEVIRGGLYDPANSSTARAVADVYAAGADPTDMHNALVKIPFGAWSMDTMSVGNVAMSDYPIGMLGVAGGPYETQGYLGLFANSTFLRALKQAGHIASLSYSWWWGIDYGDSPMDGSIVFGGYDAAKTTGMNYTGTIDQSVVQCHGGMYATVSDMSIGFTNGTSASIMAGTTAKAPFTVCLVPDWNVVMSFQSDPYFTLFEELTETNYIGRVDQSGINFWAMTYDQNNVFDGNFTVSLTNGLSITVPNENLVRPSQYMAADGTIQTNASVRELLFNPLAGDWAGSMPYLGRQFFAQAYLTVDFDESTFFISEATATNDSRLVALGAPCEDSNVVSISSSATAISTSPSTTPTASTPPTSTASHSRGPSAGAVVGGAIGGAAGLALITMTGMFTYVRRRRRRRQATRGAKDVKPSGDSSEDAYGFKPELDAGQTLGEMPASETQPNELSSDTRPLELSGDGFRHEKEADNSPVELE